MNPVEKVKSIFDGLTKPLSKDSPFNSNGRKVSFNINKHEMGNYSFQAFFARINTFESQYWAADPNVAVFLAKYGFKMASGYKVQCVSCRIEMDFECFLLVKKADVIHTLAVRCHKEDCRWSRASTPKEYLEIPRNPRRILQDMYVTFTDLTRLKSDLPLVKKECWIQMGITEDFVQAILDFFDVPINNRFSASCAVLSLCGWVKRSDTTLQCNFCQSVIGDDYQKPILRAKQSRVVSLLYNEIKRDMGIRKTGDESSADRIHEKGTSENVPETVVVPENRKTGTYSTPTGCSEFKTHSTYSWIKSRDDNIQTGLKISENEKTQVRETSSVMLAQELKRKAFRFLWNDSRRWREKYPFKGLRLNMETESRVLPILSMDELSRPPVQCEELPPAQCEDSPRSKVPHEVPQMPLRQRVNIGGIITEAILIDDNEWLVPSKVDGIDDQMCRTSDNECTSDTNDECRFDPSGASMDNNGHSSVDHSNGEGLNTQCKSFAHDEEILVESSDKNYLSMPPEKFIPGYSLSTDDTVCSFTNGKLRSEVEEAPFEMCHLHPSSCNCEICATRTNLNIKLDVYDNSMTNQSEKSCNNSEDSVREVNCNSSGRRKRKRVHESEQNGTPNSSDKQVLQEPAHYTRSKKKVFEMMRNEPAHFTRSKKKEYDLMRDEISKSQSEFKSRSNNARVSRSDNEHASREAVHAKKILNVQKTGGPLAQKDEMNNDAQNAGDTVNNRTEGKSFISGRKPGKCSMRANTFQNVQEAEGPSTCRNEIICGTHGAEKYQTGGKELINGRTSGEYSLHATGFQSLQKVGDPSTFRGKIYSDTQNAVDTENYRTGRKAFIHGRRPGEYSVYTTRFQNFQDVGGPSTYKDEMNYINRCAKNYQTRETEFIHDFTEGENTMHSTGFQNAVQYYPTPDEYSSGPRIVSSKSVRNEEMLQNYVEEESRNLENGYGAYRLYSGASVTQHVNNQCDNYGEDVAYEKYGENDDEDSEKNKSRNTIVISSSQSSCEGEDEGDKSVEKEKGVGNIKGVDSKNIITECSVVLSRLSTRDLKRGLHDSVKSTSESAIDISSPSSSVVEGESDKILSGIEVMIHSPQSDVRVEGEVNLPNKLRTPSCKRKRKKSEEDCIVSCELPNIEQQESEICHSYVHPELEHRFWCIWRINFSDGLDTLTGKRKGWECFADSIQKALKLYETEKHSVLEMEKKAFSDLSEIINVIRQRKSKNASS